MDSVAGTRWRHRFREQYVKGRPRPGPPSAARQECQSIRLPLQHEKAEPIAGLSRVPNRVGQSNPARLGGRGETTLGDREVPWHEHGIQARARHGGTPVRLVPAGRTGTPFPLGGRGSAHHGSLGPAARIQSDPSVRRQRMSAFARPRLGPRRSSSSVLRSERRESSMSARRAKLGALPGLGPGAAALDGSRESDQLAPLSGQRPRWLLGLDCRGCGARSARKQRRKLPVRRWPQRWLAWCESWYVPRFLGFDASRRGSSLSVAIKRVYRNRRTFLASVPALV